MAAISVYGLSSNGYYIYNPIFIEVNFTPSAGEVMNFFVIKIVSASDSSINSEIKVYPKTDQNSVKLDISGTVKSFFKKPVNNTVYVGSFEENSNREVLNFTFTAHYLFEGTPMQKIRTEGGYRFFRGGLNNNSLNNQTAAVGSVLRKSEKLPYWSGYPTAEYTVNENFGIVKNTVIDTIENKERRIVTGCNNFYIKFLNSLGGYSYWLFQGLKESKNTTNLGYSNVFNEFKDFGNRVERKVSVYSKVPARFYPLIEDLVESSSIFLYNYSDMTWYPIKNENNRTEFDVYKKNYEVKLNFELISNYNPTIW